MSRLHLALRIALHVWHGSSGYVRSDRRACRAGTSKAVLGEGMPAYQDPSSRGKLIIEVQLLPVRPHPHPPATPRLAKRRSSMPQTPTFVCQGPLVRRIRFRLPGVSRTCRLWSSVVVVC